MATALLLWILVVCTLVAAKEIETSDGFFVVNARNYSTALMKGPRSSHVFVLFTTSNPEHNCQACDQTHAIFDDCARSFQHFSGDVPVYFTVVDYSVFPEPFSMHQLNSAPILGYFPPLEKKKRGSLSPENIYRPYTLPTQEEVLAFLNFRTNMQVKLIRPPGLLVQIALGVVVVCALVLPSVLFDPSTAWRRVLWNKQNAFILCLVVFFCGVAGTVYCVLRGSPFWFHHANPKNWKKTFQLFSQSSQSQSWTEGFAQASCYLGFALAVVLLVETAKRSEGGFVKDVLSSLWMSCALVIFIHIVYNYVWKSRWYGVHLEMWKDAENGVKWLYKLSKRWLLERMG